MIYLLNSTQTQEVLIRKPMAGSRDNNLHFTLFSRSEWREVLSTDVAAISSRTYYRFKVTLTDNCPTGEYRYELTIKGNVVSSGLAQVGAYTNATVEKASSGIQFKQYGE